MPDVSAKIAGLGDSAVINGMTIPARLIGTQTGPRTADRSGSLVSGGDTDQEAVITILMMGQKTEIHVKGKINILENLQK